MEEAARKVLEAITELIQADGVWVEKLNMVDEVATNEDMDNELHEFLSWFDGE